MAPATLSCLKYSLAFLLGAVTFAFVIFLQLQRGAVLVEIHWKGGGGLSSKTSSYSPGVDHNHSSTGASNVALLDGLKVNSSNRKSISRDDIDIHSLKLQQKSNLLSRRARQLPLDLSGEVSLNIASNALGSRRNSRRNARTKSVKSEEIVTSIPIEEVLPQTAPDWKGSALPPVQLPNVEQCSEEYCLEYLSKVERRQFDECKQRTLNEQDRFGSIQSNASSCHFLNGTSRHPVALASFQGSGNTWMRGLLQKITGICTGTVDWVTPISSSLLLLLKGMFVVRGGHTTDGCGALVTLNFCFVVCSPWLRFLLVVMGK